MEMEPSQLLRAMDVDLGAGLGDDLGGFEGFDDLFGNHNTSDFFKFCPLDEAQPDVVGVTAPPSPGSSGVSASPLLQGEHDFAKDDWSRGQQQTPIWESALTPELTPRMHARGKPRARKRHDEDEALEAEEATHPVLKRRSSAASVMKTDDFSTTTGLLKQAASSGQLSEKSHSFDVSASAGCRPMTEGRRTGAAAIRGQQEGARAMQLAPTGGAIKVKKDVTSGLTRPRISVFMSSSRPRAPKKNSSAYAMPLDGSSRRMMAHPSPLAAAALPGSYSSSPSLEPTMDRTASAQAQRLKDLRIAVRPRSQAEQYVVETNPSVVAMGSRRAPLSAQGDQFAIPTLRRAGSVGALTIAGNGEVLSTSPVLSPTGRILQSCHLSDQAGDGGGRRRNLVCKVFGSGSPFSHTTGGSGH